MKKQISYAAMLLSATLAVSAVPAYAADGVAADGVYETSAEGKDGDVVVETTIENGVITSVVVLEQNETPEIAAKPLEEIPNAIVAANAYNVDGITGATITSDAIKNAVAEAITEAGGDLSAYEKGAEEETEGEVVELECDTVVVGAGAAGMTAAIASQDNGASTILLEKGASIGGVSIIAGGPMGIDSRLQEEAGVAGTFTINEVWQQERRNRPLLIMPDIISMPLYG